MTYPTIPPQLILDRPCPGCGGGYLQDYLDGGPQLIQHEGGCDVYDDILNRLATAIAYSVLLAAFAELGVTRRAFDLTAEAVLATDAIERIPDA